MDDLPLYLVILHSSDAPLIGREFAVESLPPVLTVGRDPACTLQIRSNAVSRRHARFERTGQEVRVIDEGSTHGTFVNETRVQDAVLREGDKLRLGDTLFSLGRLIIETEYRPSAADGLTGLATRRMLREHLDAAMRGGARPLAVIRIDVDKLSIINDERGHAAADRLLAEIGARLRASMRPGEYPARIGGDDFVVVLPGTEVRAASARAEELRMQLAAIVPVSVGAAEVTAEHRDAEELIYTAEKDLVSRYRRRT